MLKEFAKDVEDLTNKSVSFEVLPAGSGVGLDNTAWLSWFLYGGGKECRT